MQQAVEWNNVPQKRRVDLIGVNAIKEVVVLFNRAPQITAEILNYAQALWPGLTMDLHSLECDNGWVQFDP